MATCNLCGQKATWFQNHHPACVTRAEDLKKKLHVVVAGQILHGGNKVTFDELSALVKELAVMEKVPLTYVRESVINAANTAVTEVAMKAPISESDLNRLSNILRGFGMEDYRAEYAHRKWFGLGTLFLSCTLWQVIHGQRPYYDGVGRIQFNVHRDEYPIFSAGKVVFAEERTVSSGRDYRGLCVPIGAGIYYRVGRSEGHQTSGLLPLDVGEMLVTNRAIYFGGQKRTFRIGFNQIIRYQTYIDGIGICESSYGTPKVFIPDFSGMDTGWFFFNLLSELNRQAAA